MTQLAIAKGDPRLSRLGRGRPVLARRALAGARPLIASDRTAMAVGRLVEH